jgi:hypothetical protein
MLSLNNQQLVGTTDNFEQLFDAFQIVSTKYHFGTKTKYSLSLAVSPLTPNAG